MNDKATKTDDAKGRGAATPGPEDLSLRAERQPPNCPLRTACPRGGRRARSRRRWDERRDRRGEGRPLVLSPLCWAKLMLFLHGGETEVGGFGVSAAGDPLYLEDFVSVRQRVTATSVAFDDAAVADHFDACVDAGLPPA